MNTHSQLIPHKHLRFTDSLIGLAGFIRSQLNEPHTPDELWTLLDRDNSGWLAKPTFEQLILSIDILFALKQIKLTRSGQVAREQP